MAVRCKQHMRNLHWGQEGKLVLAEHGWDMGHETRFEETQKLFQSSHWGKHVVQESLEIRIAAGALNWEESLHLSLLAY